MPRVSVTSTGLPVDCLQAQTSHNNFRNKVVLGGLDKATNSFTCLAQLAHATMEVRCTWCSLMSDSSIPITTVPNAARSST